jgi:hypothetical protein
MSSALLLSMREWLKALVWMDMSPGLTYVDGCVSWVLGTIIDISVGDLIGVSSTWGCSGSWEGVLFGLVVGLVALYGQGGGGGGFGGRV